MLYIWKSYFNKFISKLDDEAPSVMIIVRRGQFSVRKEGIVNDAVRGRGKFALIKIVRRRCIAVSLTVRRGGAFSHAK